MIKMRPPCEQVVLKDYLPLLRHKIVNILLDKGYNQIKIAEKLGISQPRVSQYLSKSSFVNKDKSEYRTSFVENIDDIASTISEGINKGKTNSELLPIICYNCKKMRNAGPICRIHFEYDKSFSLLFKNTPKNCNVCLTTEDLNKEFGKRRELLDTLEYLLTQIELSNAILPFIPEIGAQIVIKNREDKLLKENIAGIPGRIRKVKNKLQIDAKPEFGASHLLAKILIDLCKKIGPIFSLALALKTNQKLTHYLEKKLTNIVMTEEFDKDIPSVLNSLSFDTKKETFSIIDSGSFGYEPITYIFFRDIDEFMDFWDINDSLHKFD
jgi:predicted fused transcriptional regulator/phosphomethylpyrimidine kinase